MSKVSDAVGYCLQNATSGDPLDGYHHHIRLQNELDPPDECPIGELTVYWRSNDAESLVGPSAGSPPN